MLGTLHFDLRDFHPRQTRLRPTPFAEFHSHGIVVELDS